MEAGQECTRSCQEEHCKSLGREHVHDKMADDRDMTVDGQETIVDFHGMMAYGYFGIDVGLGKDSDLLHDNSGKSPDSAATE